MVIQDQGKFPPKRSGRCPGNDVREEREVDRLPCALRLVRQIEIGRVSRTDRVFLPPSPPPPPPPPSPFAVAAAAVSVVETSATAAAAATRYPISRWQSIPSPRPQKQKEF